MRILYVEDNQANLFLVQRVARMGGHEVITYSTGESALANFDSDKPNLILMDIQMPVMDGIEATRRLRADPRFQFVPIIALTALAMPGDRERCIQAGASEYISKPVSLKQLVQMIDHLIGQDGMP